LREVAGGANRRRGRRRRDGCGDGVAMVVFLEREDGGVGV
jgi:hypothetical protein